MKIMTKSRNVKFSIIRWIRKSKQTLKTCITYAKLIGLIITSKSKKGGRKIKVLAWFGAYGNTNIGDDLVFFSLRKYIPDNIVVNLSCKQQVPTTIYGVKTFYRKNRLLCKKIIKQSDALWLGGGGLFECYANSYSEGWVLSHLEPLVYAMYHGKPYGIIGIGCNEVPIPNPIIKYIFRKVCNNADFIITRDEKSKLGFERNGVVNKHLNAGLDPVITYFHPLTNTKRHIEKIAILAWPFYMWPIFHTKTQLKDIYESMSYDRIEKHKKFLSELKSLIDTLRSNYSNIIFPVFHFSDTILMDELNIPYETKTPDINHYLSQIKECDLVISMRYHGLITSVLCGKPVISISVQEKMFAFTKNFNIKSNEIGIENFSSASVLDIINRIDSVYQKECSSLQSILISKQKDIEKMYQNETEYFWNRN